MPRYSVDIDITYIPLQDREESLRNINFHLQKLKQLIEKTIPGIKVTHKTDVWKLLCFDDGSIIKIEVNGTKRGIIGYVEDKSLCARAQSEFKMGCIARVVSLSQLYGGKIAAALSRQHPRDLFDYKFMSVDSYDEIKELDSEMTLITLVSFTATPSNKKVILKWTTESEISNAGFNIYRSESEDGKYIKVNDLLISSEGSPTEGAKYFFIDKNLKNRLTYFYKLEDIDLNGSSTFHGPLKATPGFIYLLGK